jgi:hypothetical protein
MHRTDGVFDWLSRAIVCAALCGLAGCGEQGPPRYDLSGAVTWEGQPVPRGYIVFTPDNAAGNVGPGTQADIVDGRYQTAKGEGTIGGPHTVTISGSDGQPYQDGPVTNPNGRTLFSDLKQTVDLPKSAGERDFSLTK